jgi:hypothetical protein
VQWYGTASLIGLPRSMAADRATNAGRPCSKGCRTCQPELSPSLLRSNEYRLREISLH